MNPVTAVIVDYRSGDALRSCLASLRTEGLERVVVVDNAAAGTSRPYVDAATTVVEPGFNLGYGAGANRGVAALGQGDAPVLILNPDVEIHSGTLAALRRHLDADERVGIVGPTIQRPDGSTYPAHRVFPSPLLAAAHAALGSWWPTNPFTRRYRSPRDDGSVDWVSGACLLVRRAAFEAVGGFDERFFMFAEDMDLCWRVRQAGWAVVAAPDAVVTHVEGVSRRHAATAMVVAHHASALRFEAHAARGWRRAAVPLAAAVLGLRLVAVLVVDRLQLRHRA